MFWIAFEATFGVISALIVIVSAIALFQYLWKMLATINLPADEALKVRRQK